MQAQLADRGRLGAQGRPVWRTWLLCLTPWLGSFVATTVASELGLVPPAVGIGLAMLIAYVVGVVIARRRYS